MKKRMVTYKILIFCVNQNSKLDDTTGHCLTMEIFGKKSYKLVQTQNSL